MDKEEFIKLLEEIKPYVIVTGSYAENKQTKFSDIDFYIKPIPEDEIDYDTWRVADTYCENIIKILEGHGYTWGSVFVQTVHVDETYIPIELSAYYNIDEENVFKINILGVEMDASLSTYERGE